MPSRPHDHRRNRSDARSINVRVRPDLVFVETQHQNESAVIVKDPIAMQYHRLRPDEFFLLKQLQRGTTYQSLCDQYDRRFRPEKLSQSELNELLFRFHRLGLTMSLAADQGDRLHDRKTEQRRRRWQQQLSGILFLRFPGIDPEPILRRLHPLVRPLLSRVGLAIMILITLCAVVVLAVQWPRFITEFPHVQQWIQLQAILTLACVMGMTKVMHELGHAVLCKHFGGECHQIGPMLMVFTPALYCNTSDSWLLPNRYARATVGIAGIATEVLLASIATIVWASTGPSLTHFVAMNVMVVCGISTLVFNANPLLRYDGYYVLSDLCDVPNLGQRAQEQLARFAGRWALGIHSTEHDPISTQSKIWLISYALAAMLYRLLLTLVILWFLLVTLRTLRLESVGLALTSAALIGMLVAALRAPIRYLQHPGQRRQIRMARVLVAATVIALLLFVAALPLPSGEWASGRLVPRREAAIYVTTPGHLDQLNVTVGSLIKAGEAIAVLENSDIVLQCSKAESRVAAQRDLVQSLESSRLTVPDAANELPAAQALLLELERQLQTRQERRDALTLRSPMDGRLIAPPQRRTAISHSDLTLASWNGDPTAAYNHGCFLESGTELFTVIAEDAWDAELIVTATQAQRIEIGQSVNWILESDPAMTRHGIVTEIATKQWTADENGQRRDDDDGTRLNAPLQTSYSVLVQLDQPAQGTPIEFITAADNSARISTQPISFFNRAIRNLNRLLRFR